MARIKVPKQTFSLFDGLTPDDIAFYETRWVDFIHDFIFDERSVRYGGDLDLSPEQEEIIMAVCLGEKDKTSAVTGKGFGKTTIMALLILTFISLRLMRQTS